MTATTAPTISTEEVPWRIQGAVYDAPRPNKVG
jgi:hypothetical protein